MIADSVSISLLLGAFLVLMVSIFMLVGGTLAWYEVAYHKKNGLTLKMRTFLYANGVVHLLSSSMTFYASLSPIHTSTFLVMTWVSNISIVFLLLSCIWLVKQVMGEAENG